MAESTVTTQTLTSGAPVGASVPIGKGAFKSVQLSGAWSGTVKVQVSNDGANWIDHLTLTANGLENITVDAALARANFSTATSGSPSVTFHQVS